MSVSRRQGPAHHQPDIWQASQVTVGAKIYSFVPPRNAKMATVGMLECHWETNQKKHSWLWLLGWSLWELQIIHQYPSPKHKIYISNCTSVQNANFKLWKLGCDFQLVIWGLKRDNGAPPQCGSVFERCIFYHADMILLVITLWLVIYSQESSWQRAWRVGPTHSGLQCYWLFLLS